MADEYKCVACGGVFEKTWSDEEALAEMVGYFGEVPEHEQVVVCDDCFQAMHPEDHPERVAEAKAELGVAASPEANAK